VALLSSHVSTPIGPSGSSTIGYHSATIFVTFSFAASRSTPGFTLMLIALVRAGSTIFSFVSGFSNSRRCMPRSFWSTSNGT
jgi:hypothetical protein